jgi:hypothetical protein
MRERGAMLLRAIDQGRVSASAMPRLQRHAALAARSCILSSPAAR